MFENLCYLYSALDDVYVLLPFEIPPFGSGLIEDGIICLFD